MPKAKICIKNIVITDIPSRSNRIFLKLKSGHNSVISNKYQIGVNNSVAFQDMIVIEHDFKQYKKGHFEVLRFSFRFEKSNGTDFKRYGSFNVIDLELNKFQLNPYHISRNLEKCKERPKVTCDIILLDSKKIQKKTCPNVTFSNPILPDKAHRRAESSAPCLNRPIIRMNEVSSKSDPCKKNQQMLLCIDDDGKTCSVSSYSLGDSFSKTIPLQISQEKYSEIEKEIDHLLADIINNAQD